MKQPLVPVSEIFASIQGEGIASGRPSIFVRFAGCNLACTWCDTAYASWDLKPYRSMTVQEVVDRVRELNQSLVIVTGGEPTHFGDVFLDVSRALVHEGLTLHLETNATIYLEEVPGLYAHAALSPKLPASGEGDSFRPDILEAYFRSGLSLELKLVIASDEDLEACERWMRKLDVPPEVPLVLQPDGLGKDPMAAGRRLAEMAAKKEGPFAGALGQRDLRILGQWQRIYWDGKRGK